MLSLKILSITEKIVLVNDIQHQPFRHSPQSPSRLSGYTLPHKRPSNTTTTTTTTFLYDITFSFDGGHTLIRIERPKTDIVCLVQALVLYFPSYQFSAQTLFQPPDQYIRDLVELQEFLNRIFSIDVGNRMIQYPKIVCFFDDVFGRSVVQRSLMRQNLRAISKMQRTIDSLENRLEVLDSSLLQCIEVLKNLQVREEKNSELVCKGSLCDCAIGSSTFEKERKSFESTE